jgi:hypothetical protein
MHFIFYKFKKYSHNVILSTQIQDCLENLTCIDESHIDCQLSKTAIVLIKAV